MRITGIDGRRPWRSGRGPGTRDVAPVILWNVVFNIING
jgi:hypothetical protein